MNEQEIVKLVTELSTRFDRTSMIGAGWSGNPTLGFMFNPESGGALFVGGKGIGGPPGGGGPPPPTGACCNLDGSCTVTTASYCAVTGGTYQGDGTPCDPNPCTSGACCNDGFCSVLTQTACLNSGGVYMGDGIPCTLHLCDLGPCCPGAFQAFDGSSRYFLTETTHAVLTFTAASCCGAHHSVFDYTETLHYDPVTCVLSHTCSGTASCHACYTDCGDVTPDCDCTGTIYMFGTPTQCNLDVSGCDSCSDCQSNLQFWFYWPNFDSCAPTGHFGCSTVTVSATEQVFTATWLGSGTGAITYTRVLSDECLHS